MPLTSTRRTVKKKKLNSMVKTDIIITTRKMSHVATAMVTTGSMTHNTMPRMVMTSKT